MRQLAFALLVFVACSDDKYSVETLQDPNTCSTCHPTHFTEWSGSMHAYASTDPVFVGRVRAVEIDDEVLFAVGDGFVRVNHVGVAHAHGDARLVDEHIDERGVVREFREQSLEHHQLDGNRARLHRQNTRAIPPTPSCEMIS